MTIAEIHLLLAHSRAFKSIEHGNTPAHLEEDGRAVRKHLVIASRFIEMALRCGLDEGSITSRPRELGICWFQGADQAADQQLPQPVLAGRREAWTHLVDILREHKISIVCDQPK